MLYGMLLGDFVAKITQAMGVAPCQPCKQRQAALNAWHAQVTGQPAPPQPPTQTFIIDARNGQVVRVTR